MYYSSYGPPVDPYATFRAPASDAGVPHPGVPDPALQHRLTPEILAALRAPFGSQVRYLPLYSDVGDGRRLLDPIVPSRVVRQRLDEVLGLDGYREDYSVSGAWVVCRLSLCGLTRTGMADDSSDYGGAPATAFMYAALGFGIGQVEAELGPMTATKETLEGLAPDKQSRIDGSE